MLHSFHKKHFDLRARRGFGESRMKQSIYYSTFKSNEKGGKGN